MTALRAVAFYPLMGLAWIFAAVALVAMWLVCGVVGVLTDAGKGKR